MMLRYLGWKEAADLIMQGVRRHHRRQRNDLRPRAPARGHPRRPSATSPARKNVEEDLQRLIPGATLLTCSGFGDAIIKRMQDDARARSVRIMAATFCPDCTLLPAARRHSCARPRMSNPDYHCKPVAPFGEAAAEAADRGPRARHARRQSHRPAVHRRLRRDPLI